MLGWRHIHRAEATVRVSVSVCVDMCSIRTCADVKFHLWLGGCNVVCGFHRIMGMRVMVFLFLNNRKTINVKRWFVVVDYSDINGLYYKEVYSHYAKQTNNKHAYLLRFFP